MKYENMRAGVFEYEDVDAMAVGTSGHEYV